MCIINGNALSKKSIPKLLYYFKLQQWIIKVFKIEQMKVADSCKNCSS